MTTTEDPPTAPQTAPLVRPTWPPPPEVIERLAERIVRDLRKHQ